ncbi:unnamed protein product [Tetraodon nigroviridis]|uniref:(spotted green pufferfish) hypothetical protein n=1 Tax=Tetraodon nigroviridis TaxID=99883 RepID=Q4S066_TETNG|nr:unnamed protein product [Tetraodon nigroviridis]
MSRRQRALLALVLLLWRVAAAEYSTRSEPDYEFGDYRGRWCIDDHGFVYGIGELYYPSPSACPCTCTVDGPVCVRPKCPRVHPRCTRIRYQACCPVCEAMARVCVYGGRTYRLLEEFRLSRCERCRCGANREVYCSISDCPAPQCVNPTYEPNHCCPVCRSGESPTGRRSQLFRWKPGDPSGRTREHRRADHLLLHLPGRHVAHSPPGHLRAAFQARPHTQPQHGAPRGDGDQAQQEEALCSQAGRDTVSDGPTVLEAGVPAELPTKILPYHSSNIPWAKKQFKWNLVCLQHETKTFLL